MKSYSRRNIRKNREIKDSDKCIILDIYLEFGSLDKIRIIPSYPKDNSVRSGKRMVTSLSINTNVRSNKYQKSRYDINNVSMKVLSKIIKDFEKIAL